jgi:ribosomal protein L12E/L44/L45/RPP1/RPP2
MLSKENLIEIMVGISMTQGGNATEASRRDFFKGMTFDALKKEYDAYTRRTVDRALAAETTRELEQQKLRDELIRQQQEWNAKQNPPADEKENRKIFTQVCRQCGIAENDANFSILVQACNGDLFDAFTAGLAVKKSPDAYAPASPQEQQKWAREDAQAQRETTIKHQHWLQHKATPQQLREAAQRERQQKIENRSFAQEQLELEVCMARKRDLENGLPPLPHQWNNAPLDSAAIKRASILTLRTLISRYGQAAVTARLYSLKHVEATVLGEFLSFDFD